eukprot:GHVL01015945.1.p1 GENE.GHVL01015945.1~~GHVL01015945.1.p1  ORF type:complete len:143 (+),score=6.74 GHVL01015945.1:1279-1707(+)
MSELDVTWARYAQHVDLGVELDTACQPPRRHQHAHRLYISVALPLHQPAVDITRRVLCPSQATAQTHTHTHRGVSVFKPKLDTIGPAQYTFVHSLDGCFIRTTHQQTHRQNGSNICLGLSKLYTTILALLTNPGSRREPRRG